MLSSAVEEFDLVRRSQTFSKRRNILLCTISINKFQLNFLMNSFPTLQTDRLTLREILPSDSCAIFQIFGNAQVMSLSGSDPLSDIDSASALIDYFTQGFMLATPDIRWGIQLKDNPNLIGTCGLFAWNPGWKKCSVGYELDHAWQRKGLMCEALSEVLAWGFRETSLHRIEAQAHPENFPSIRLMKSLGFIQEGLLREAGHWGGQIHDMLQFGLLRHELRTMTPAKI